MVLETYSNVIQTKNALTQYVTIPATMVADSQYPFRDAGKVKVTVEPDQKYIIISREGITFRYTKYGVLLLNKGSADLPAEFDVRQLPNKDAT